MSSTTARAELARGFYASSSIALWVTGSSPDDPLFAFRRAFGERFPRVALEALEKLGPHLIADVEEGRATLDEAVYAGLLRVEGALRRRLAGELATLGAAS